MHIDKIKNYNQRLLAILGTLGCLLLFLFIVIMVIEMIPGRNYDSPPQGLIADEQVEALNQDNLRKQIISYESPWLVDTLKGTYIIPVSIKTLKKPEEVIHEVESGAFDLMNINSGGKFSKGYYYRESSGGRYANLIIYQSGEDQVKSLFNERVIIGEIDIARRKNDVLLAFYVASKDTNKNGIIDMDDLRSLCIYSLETGILRWISTENQIEEYAFVDNSKDLLVKFGLNKYDPKQFDNNRPPSKVMRYKYDTQKLIDIITAQIQDEMQKLVEGK